MWFQTLFKFSHGEAISNSISSVGGYGRSSRFVGRYGVTTLIVQRRRNRFVITRYRRTYHQIPVRKSSFVFTRWNGCSTHCVSNGSSTHHAFQTAAVLSGMSWCQILNKCTYLGSFILDSILPIVSWALTFWGHHWSSTIITIFSTKQVFLDSFLSTSEKRPFQLRLYFCNLFYEAKFLISGYFHQLLRQACVNDLVWPSQIFERHEDGIYSEE